MQGSFTRKRFLFYLGIGAAYFVFWLLVDLTSFPGTVAVRVQNNLWRVIYITLINFIFFEHTLPYVLKKRKFLFLNILLFVFFFWVQTMLVTFGLYAWRSIGIYFHLYVALRTFDSITHGVSFGAAFGIFSLFFFGGIRHFFNYRKLQVATQQLRIQKQEAELNYLKSQTNPHFLFNTLNNIYALTREKSDRAPESVLRLSKILRYMLYEAGGAYIAIEQELKIIADYIELEKLRYDESLRIGFSHDVEDRRQSIPPLLLMPLVENAFKHGASETRTEPFVDIHLTVRNRRLQFTVRNSTDRVPGDYSVQEHIGLSNLRRQLELLYTDYRLTVTPEENVFTAMLTINLASHV